MGPAAITVLALIMSTTRLTHLDISGNGLSGATWNYGWQRWDNADSDLNGIAALAEALPSSHLESLAISQCELGPKSIAIVASALPVAGLEVLDVSFNRFDATSHLDGIDHSVHLNLSGCHPGAQAAAAAAHSLVASPVIAAGAVAGGDTADEAGAGDAAEQVELELFGTSSDSNVDLFRQSQTLCSKI